MSANFCFPFTADLNCSATFHCSDGEEYIAQCKYIASDYYMDLRWTKVSTKLIRVSCYRQDNMQLILNKIQFVKNQVCVSFPLRNNSTTYDKNRFFIAVKVIPFARMTDNSNYNPSCANSYYRNRTFSKNDEPVMEEKNLEQLPTYLKELLQTGQFSDIVLTDGANELFAHKLVLSLRSSVFAKMFQHPMQENENRITIKDIPIEILRELLHFMYTETVAIKDSKMVRNLYVAADKYDVKELKAICSVKLESVDLNDVLDTLLLADLYSEKSLKEAALHFIAKHYSQLKMLENWNSFMKENQALAIEILSFAMDTKI